MKTIDLKMLRDLRNMRGQVIAIAFVVIAAVSVYVTMTSVGDTLQDTLDTYYYEFAFADGFASVRRAPESLAERIRDVPGVQQVETRITGFVNLEISGFEEPVMGQIISMPENRQPLLNQLYIREGRLVDPNRENEVMLNEEFSEAHDLGPGDEFTAIINGRSRTLTVVAVVLSPEFIYQTPPGMIFPDPERFGVMWMGKSALASAYDMAGAFNDLSFTLTPGGRINDVIDRLDLLLMTYGGEGAYTRENQLSHSLISQEIEQLQAIALLLPLILLAVAAFLLNIVVSRLISLQREQIAILKAFGYSNLAVALHYLKMILFIALSGAAAGVLVSFPIGGAMTDLFLDYFKFPYLDYQLGWEVVFIAVLLTAGASVAGAVTAVRRALKLPPAEAMRPAPPPSFQKTLLERLGIQKWFDQPTRIILRNLDRQRIKTILTVTGISTSCAILVMGLFFSDIFDHMVRIEYGIAQREDITVTFTEPASASAMFELKSLPGVQFAEPFRSVPVRFRNEHRSYDAGIEGIPPDPYLRRALDTDQKPVPIPSEGIVLTQNLAGILQLNIGDDVLVEVMEGRRYERSIPVVGISEQYLGIGAYMNLDAVNRLAGSGSAISGAYLMIDERYEQDLTRALQDRPRVAGIVAQERAISGFMDTAAGSILAFTFIMSLFAGVIAFGVIYNSMRISLSERDRELASMRVLGFTRGEISYILLGEMAFLILLAIPLGFVIGFFMAGVAVEALQTDMYSFPFVMSRSTFALSAAIVLVSAGISALLIRRRLNKLDLIKVLKTRG